MTFESRISFLTYCQVLGHPLDVGVLRDHSGPALYCPGDSDLCRTNLFLRDRLREVRVGEESRVSRTYAMDRR